MKPYYSRQYAEDAKDLLDALEKSKRLIISAKELGIERSTLRIRLYNSLDYLCEKMDAEGKYTKIRSDLVISSLKEGVLVELDLTPKSLLSVASNPDTLSVKDRVLNFLADAKIGALLDLKELSLSEELILGLKDILTQAGEEYLFSITKEHLKIRRIGSINAKIIL